NHWLAGENDQAFEHLRAAQQLVEDMPSSPVKARVHVTLSRLLTLAAHGEEAIPEGEQALAMAEELGLDGIRTSALVNIATARANLEGTDAPKELAAAAEAARAANDPFEA